MKIQSTTDVLIAQIPRGGPRWGQGNFNLSVFRSFFHLNPKIKQSVILHPLDASGATLPPEPRKSVTPKSRNFRFELGLARGRTYPNGGPPIAIFRPLAEREFRYRLVFPSESLYAALRTFTEARRNRPAWQKIRVIVPYAMLLSAVPKLKL